jgi:Holliday junction resolvasome RuvABC endonuclease subunit
MEKILTNTNNNQEVAMEKLFENAIASSSKSNNRASGEVGVMSIVKAKTGNRSTLARKLLKKLNNPEKVQAAFTEDSVIIGEKLPNNNSSFNIKISGAKGIIYSTQLVKEIAELFGLDFSDRTSITFNDVKYVLNEEYPVAIVKIK